jgi:hypothetical protein
MRKFILISVLTLASVTAQAGQTKGLVLASNEERIESVTPEERKAPVKSEATQPVRETPTPVKQVYQPPKPAFQPPTPKPVSRPIKQASLPASRVHARGYEDQEAKARRIAAAYGVSW